MQRFKVGETVTNERGSIRGVVTLVRDGRINVRAVRIIEGFEHVEFHCGLEARDFKLVYNRESQLKYKKKPDIIEAIKFNAERWIYQRKEAYPMVDTRLCYNGESSLGKYFMYEPVIPTLSGNMCVLDGDYIIEDADDGFYVVESGIFEAKYEIAEGEN